MKLSTTDTEFNQLEHATAKRSDVVRVPKPALRALLADHCTLVAAARKAGVVIEIGPDQRSLA